MSTASKIVLVAGQRFPVPSATDNETVRQHLIGMGFADVANAEIKKGTDADGNETIEFVKRAGTKGLIAASDLLTTLRRIPRATGLVAPDTRQLLDRLLAEQLTFGEALADDRLAEALQTLDAHADPRGAHLCQRLDRLPAVADPSAGRAW